MQNPTLRKIHENNGKKWTNPIARHVELYVYIVYSVGGNLLLHQFARGKHFPVGPPNIIMRDTIITCYEDSFIVFCILILKCSIRTQNI